MNVQTSYSNVVLPSCISSSQEIQLASSVVVTVYGNSVFAIKPNTGRRNCVEVVVILLHISPSQTKDSVEIPSTLIQESRNESSPSANA